MKVSQNSPLCYFERLFRGGGSDAKRINYYYNNRYRPTIRLARKIHLAVSNRREQFRVYRNDKPRSGKEVTKAKICNLVRG